jgi:hypothetical protein
LGRFEVTLGKDNDHLAEMLSRMGSEGKNILKKAVYAGAGITADEVRKRLEGVLEGGTGELASSLGISKFKDKFGTVHTFVGFSGYDSMGVPNILNARVIESGRSDSKKKKRPFFRPAIKAAAPAAEKAMADTVEKEIKKLQKK